jgi:hypothetical protein
MKGGLFAFAERGLSEAVPRRNPVSGFIPLAALSSSSERVAGREHDVRSLTKPSISLDKERATQFKAARLAHDCGLQKPLKRYHKYNLITPACYVNSHSSFS